MLRLWFAMAVGVVALVASGVLASMARAQAGTDPSAVIAAYEMARNARDVDGALSYFADDATITQRTTTFSGKDAIRKYLEGVSSRARYIVVTDRQASGNRVNWTERASGLAVGQQQSGSTQAGGASSTASNQGFSIGVEAIVQDGKIRSLAYLPLGTPLRTDPSLDGRAELPASVGLAAVLMVLASIVVVASVGLGRASIGGSTLRGRLMQDLQGWSAGRQ